MRFEILFAPEAVEDLKALKANLRAEVKDAIERHLRDHPTRTSRARIKRLRGVSRPQFRLRVGDVRVFYDVKGNEAHVLAVVLKDDADEWLRKVGQGR
jgi:mRNA-degrading endonuclease RelE of RelBE toxin-antitoxin system